MQYVSLRQNLDKTYCTCTYGGDEGVGHPYVCGNMLFKSPSLFSFRLSPGISPVCSQGSVLSIPSPWASKMQCCACNAKQEIHLQLVNAELLLKACLGRKIARIMNEHVNLK